MHPAIPTSFLQRLLLVQLVDCERKESSWHAQF